MGERTGSKPANYATRALRMGLLIAPLLLTPVRGALAIDIPAPKTQQVSNSRQRELADISNIFGQHVLGSPNRQEVLALLATLRDAQATPEGITFNQYGTNSTVNNPAYHEIGSDILNYSPGHIKFTVNTDTGAVEKVSTPAENLDDLNDRFEAYGFMHSGGVAVPIRRRPPYWSLLDRELKELMVKVFGDIDPEKINLDQRRFALYLNPESQASYSVSDQGIVRIEQTINRFSAPPF
jgi:hypothetical protein